MRQFISITTLCLLFVACEFNDYKSGDNALSYLRADFAEAHTSAVGRIDHAVNDAGEHIRLSPPLVCNWASKADTLYRTLLYYQRTDDAAYKPLAAVRVAVLALQPASTLPHVPTDPVTLESLWLSKSRKYINLSLLLKTGKGDVPDARQQLGMVIDGTETDAEGKRHDHLRLLHAQNNVPEYYSHRVYISLPAGRYHAGDRVTLTVNTYQGTIQRTVSFP